MCLLFYLQIYIYAHITFEDNSLQGDSQTLIYFFTVQITTIQCKAPKPSLSTGKNAPE